MKLKIGDTLENLVSGLGVWGRDKAAHRAFVLRQMQQQEVDAAYRSDWMARKIVDIPAFDMTREWRTFQIDRKDIGIMEAEEKRLGVRQKVAKAIWWSRLRGGSGLIMDDGATDLMSPLNVTGQGGLRQLIVVPRSRLKAGSLQWDPYDEGFDLPTKYVLSSGQRGGVDVHPSRVITFMGAPIPDDDGADPETKVYGDPILVAVREAVMQAAGSNAAISSLLEEAKVDVIKVPGLLGMVMSKEYRDQLQTRWELASILKALNGVFLMDGAEEWERKEANFSGLPDVARLFLQIVSGAADIPATRMLGQSPQGMNATGESDLQNYEAMIAAKQRNDITPRLDRLDEVLLVSGLGTKPKATQWSKWNPLRIPTPKERREAEKQMADTARAIVDSGLVPVAAMEVAFQNLLIEEGVYPGLEDAIEQAKAGQLLPFEDPADAENDIDPKTGQPYPEGDPRNPRTAAEREAQAEASKPRTLRLVAGDQTIKAVVQRPDPRKARDAKPRTLYVSRPLLNAQEFIDWAKSQGFETTLEAGDLHVTVAFSKRPVDWMAVPSDWSPAGDDGTLTVPPGGARLVEPLGNGGAVVLLFSSGNLAYRHGEIERAGATWDFPEYQPHVTITWSAPAGLDLSKVEPFRGPLRFGPEVFEEIVENWRENIEEA